MDFIAALFIFLPLLCQTSAQSGSSFFYYYSPKQPMIINSQTFGNNAQSHQRLVAPSSNNPFNFNLNPPHDQQSQDQGQTPYRTETPFIPQRTAFPTVQSIIDKIAQTNAPAIAAQPPQFHRQQGLESPEPTSAFPGQAQPSAKLFNFLNQPFQFFQNSFNRFPQTQTTSAPPPASQNYYTTQQQSSRFNSANAPQLDNGNYENPNQQHFYNYYSHGGTQPQPTLPSYEAEASVDHVTNSADRNPIRNYNHVQREPTTYTNQYFSSKNAQGPTTSYSLTIGADPTTGPTATVHVSMGRPQSDTNRFQHPRRPTNYLPQRFDKNQEQQGHYQTKIEDVAQSIEVQDAPIQEAPLFPQTPQSNDEDIETEMIITTTSKPGVILMVIAAAEPTVPSTTPIPETVTTTTTTTEPTTSTTTTSTTEPTTSTTTTSTTSTTTTTTTTPKPTVPAKVDDLKTPKRVIIRKKIGRKRVRVFGKNRTVVPDSKPIQENIAPVNVSIPEEHPQSIVPIATTSEIPVETTTPRRIRTRTRITTTSLPEIIETTTTPTTTSSLVSVIPQTTEQISQPETDKSVNLDEHYDEPVTTPSYPSTVTTEVPFLTPSPEEIITTTSQLIIESTTVKAPQSEQQPAHPSSDTYPVYDENDYEYYYNDGETTNINEVHDTSIPIDGHVQSTPSSTTTTEAEKSEPSTTELAATTRAPELQESSTQPGEDPLEDEVIEPLSTTGATVVSTSTTEASTEIPDHTTTPRQEIVSDLSVSTTTEKFLEETTTESVPIIATTTTTTTTEIVNAPEVSNPDNTSDKPAIVRVSSTETPNVHEESNTQNPEVDYSNFPTAVERGQTDPVQPQFVANGTNEAVSNVTVLEENYDDFPEQYAYSQEEEYVDPHAEEKIKEAQRLAHLNALKNIRNRIQNASTTTTVAPEEDGLDNTKKFIRKPTNVTSFPAGSSSSGSQNTYDDEDLGDSDRTQIIRKIQTFRTKLRRVASSRSVSSSSSNSNFVRSTTKRPRRVTRPSDRSTSTTLATVEVEEYDSEEKIGNSNQVASNPKESGKTEPLSPKKQLQPSPSPSPPSIEIDEPAPANISNPEDSSANINYDVNELETPKSDSKAIDLEVASPKVEQDPIKLEAKTTEQTPPEIETPKNASLHVGELIIHEILPTQSTTTETISTEDGVEMSTENFDEDADFQSYSMEDEVSSKLINATSSVTFSTSEGVSSEPILSEGLESSTTETLPITSTKKEVISSVTTEPEVIAATFVSVETTSSKADNPPQRKIKVILKRKKGAPPGSGTVARQVVRTRTRLRAKVPAA